MPIAMFRTRTIANTASRQSPTASTAMAQVAKMALKSVKMLERKIALTGREVAESTLLLCPLA